MQGSVLEEFGADVWSIRASFATYALLGTRMRVTDKWRLAIEVKWTQSGKGSNVDLEEEELKAVCSFQDWNPSHFLDVAEMAAGIALALDWAGEWLSPEVEKLARQSLVEKALKPGVAASLNNWWINVNHNWNLVCNGGLSLAALAVYEDDGLGADRPHVDPNADLI